MPTQDTDDIRRLMLDWTAAIEAEDRAGILAGHDPDVLMYDFPNEVRGIEAYDRTWNFFFASCAGPITFKARDIEVTAGDVVAFATCLIRCEGTTAGVVELRLTTGFKRVKGEWVITHEHHSVPTVEDALLPAPNK